LAEGLQRHPKGHGEPLHLLDPPPGKTATFEQIAPKDLADEIIIEGA
jgi:hypothetical protein